MTKHFSQNFGQALCRHLGLPESKVMANLKVNTERDEVFSVTLTITLQAEDLAGIAVQMEALEEAAKAARTSKTDNAR